MILGGQRMDVIKIKEYSAFRVCRNEEEHQGDSDGNYTILKEKTFNALEQFILNCKNCFHDLKLNLFLFKFLILNFSKID